jgi:hypothetical protein
MRRMTTPPAIEGGGVEEGSGEAVPPAAGLLPGAAVAIAGDQVEAAAVNLVLGHG